MRFPFRGRSDRGLEEELRHHLDLLEQEHRDAGLSAEEARFAALRDLGGAAKTKQAYREQRALPFLETLWQDLRFGARSLKRAPGMAATVVLTLMLGIGANSALFSVIDTVLFKPLPYRDPDRLVWISEANDPQNDTGVELVAIPDIVDWRARAHSLSSIAGLGLGRTALNVDGDAELIWSVSLSEPTEKILGVAPALGRGFFPEDLKAGAHQVVLLSDHLYRRRFGADSGIVGKAISLDGELCTVVGILPPDFRLTAGLPSTGPLAEADIIVNEALDPAQRFTIGAIARLNDGVKFESARTELNAILSASKMQGGVAGGSKRVLHMRPLLRQMTGASRAPLLILWAAVAFVLLVACVNVTNLLLARSASRSRETAIRMALGAGRFRLIRQLLTESLLLSSAGGAAGLLLAFWILRAAAQFGPASVPQLHDVAVDWTVLLFTAGVSLVTGILSGILPALTGSHAAPEGTLKQASRGVSAPGRRARLHGALVVSELALALVLLDGAGLMLKSLWLMNASVSQYAWDHVLAATVRVQNPRFAATLPERRQFLQEIVTRAEALPGVRSAAFYIHILGEPLLLAGEPNPDPSNHAASRAIVTPHYFQAAGLRLLAGREFGDGDREDAPPVAIVNAAYVRMYGFRDNAAIVGHPVVSFSQRSLKCGRDQPCTIAGVVSDFRERPDDDPQPEVYLPASQNALVDYTGFYVRASGDPLSLAGALRKIVGRTPDALIMNQARLGDQMSDIIAPQRFQTILLASFAGVALLLAMVGTYGVLAYAAAERTQEIGVRMALGASRGDVLRTVLARGARWTIAGVVLGLAASAALTRVLAGLLYNVKPADPSTTVTACALLIAVALPAAYLPARRAVSVDPALALRMD